jgi:hypothetical protein
MHLFFMAGGSGTYYFSFYPVVRGLCTTPGRDLHLYVVFRTSSIYCEAKLQDYFTTIPDMVGAAHKPTHGPSLDIEWSSL